MKFHCSLPHSLALAMTIMLVICTAAGCAYSPDPIEPINTGAVSTPTSDETIMQSADAPSVESQEPLASSADPSGVRIPVTEPVTKPSAQPTDTVPPSTDTGNTEHTHSFHSQVTPPTCTEKGYTTYICILCGYSYTGKETAATGHSYQDTVIASTCTEEGYTLHKCTVCGDSYSDSVTAAMGHTWSLWATIIEPTYTTEGLEERVCSVCGVTESRQIAKLQMSASQMEQEVFRLVNIERDKAGLAPLQYYSSGQPAADIRVKEIQEFFSHTRPDGRTCFTVLEDLSLDGYTAVGENIAAGYTTAEAVVAGWMNSEGHRANILNPSFTGIAVGYENNYWVQIFVG